MWEITKHSYINEDNVEYVGYGVKIGNTEIEDISCSLEKIREFAETLNRCDASEVHALELAEDFAASF